MVIMDDGKGAARTGLNPRGLRKRPSNEGRNFIAD